MTKWCYNFSVVHENCYAFFAVLYGCEGGREYKWYSGCFGWFDAYYTNKRLCFSDRLEDRGPCGEGESIPPGGTIPVGASSTSHAMTAAGTGVTLVAAATLLYPQIDAILSGLVTPESLPSAIVATALGVMMLLATFLTVLRRCGIGGVLAIILAILILILCLLFQVPLDPILILAIVLAIVGGLLGILGSEGPCFE